MSHPQYHDWHRLLLLSSSDLQGAANKRGNQLLHRRQRAPLVRRVRICKDEVRHGNARLNVDLTWRSSYFSADGLCRCFSLRITRAAEPTRRGSCNAQIGSSEIFAWRCQVTSARCQANHRPCCWRRSSNLRSLRLVPDRAFRFRAKDGTLNAHSPLMSLSFATLLHFLISETSH